MSVSISINLCVIVCDVMIYPAGNFPVSALQRKARVFDAGF